MFGQSYIASIGKPPGMKITTATPLLMVFEISYLLGQYRQDAKIVLEMMVL